MSEKYDSESNATGKLLGALCVIVAFVGGYWILGYLVHTTAPTTEVIMIQLPPEMAASNAVLVASPEAVTVELEREKPERKWFSALLHPFGFGILLLVIIGAGAGLILLVIWLDGGVRYGRE